jgi:hypothetical protein
VAESGPLSDWWSLAWTPGGEVWFAGTETGGSQTAVFGLDLTGRQRLIYRAPGALTVHDISRDGALLASFDQYRSRIEVIEPAGAADGQIDRSWKDNSRPAGLSDDHAVLFNQIGDSGGATGAVFVWRPGAPQPVQIADGFANAFSSDGRMALVGGPGRWSLVPTGTGQPRPIDLDAVGSISGAWWHPDGRLVVSGTRASGAPQIYIAAETGAVTEFLPEGFSLDEGERVISPDGARIVARNAEGVGVVCGLSSEECAPIPGLGTDENVAGWAADNASLFVFRRFPLPVLVERLDVSTGRRTAWRSVQPVQAAVSGLRTLAASPDGTLAYSYSRARTQLYVIRGLK